MSKVDLAIRHGEIVTAAGSTGSADIGISDGRIVQIGGVIEAREELDATDKLVLPGGIDAHVHLSPLPKEGNVTPHWVDNFTSGSAAALAGGITTLGNMVFPDFGDTPLVQLERAAAVAREESIADFFLHPVLDEMSNQVLDEIPKLREIGCNTIKIFLVYPNFDPQIKSYVEAIRRAGESGVLVMLHCEDHALVEDATARLVAAGKSSIDHFEHSRPLVAEVVATQRAVALAEATGTPVYIVHLSSARALDVCIEAQARGVPVYVETRPLYLHLTHERYAEPDGAKYLGCPPLRQQKDVDALWTGIRNGVVHTVCTDHAPWSLAAKLDPGHTISNIRAGVADLQTILPMLYSGGVKSGRITLGRFVQVTSTNAAKLFGLFPRKGTIAVGSDADLVIFDPNLTRSIESSMLRSNSDYSVFDGWQVTGWPLVTLRRGEIVFRDGEILGKPGTGQLVSRGAAMPL